MASPSLHLYLTLLLPGLAVLPSMLHPWGMCAPQCTLGCASTPDSFRGQWHKCSVTSLMSVGCKSNKQSCSLLSADSLGAGLTYEGPKRQQPPATALHCRLRQAQIREVVRAPLPWNRIPPACAIPPCRVQLSHWWNKALFKNAAAAITGGFPWAQIFLWQYVCIKLTGNRTAVLSSLSETCESLRSGLWVTEGALLPRGFQSAFPPPGHAVSFPFCPHVSRVAPSLPFPKTYGSPVSHFPRSIPVPLHSIFPCPFPLWLIKAIWLLPIENHVLLLQWAFFGLICFVLFFLIDLMEKRRNQNINLLTKTSGNLNLRNP